MPHFLHPQLTALPAVKLSFMYILSLPQSHTVSHFTLGFRVNPGVPWRADGVDVTGRGGRFGGDGGCLSRCGAYGVRGWWPPESLRGRRGEGGARQKLRVAVALDHARAAFGNPRATVRAAAASAAGWR